MQVKNKKYGATDGFAGENFPSDIFLVFGNRLLAMVVAAAMVMLPLRQEPPGGWTPQVKSLHTCNCVQGCQKLAGLSKNPQACNCVKAVKAGRHRQRA